MSEDFVVQRYHENSGLTLAEAKSQNETLRKFCFEILVEGVDYGVIEGTDKKVLFKPGAERLCQFLRLYPKFLPLSVTEDFEKPLFFYRYECQLLHMQSGAVVGTGIGSCNSYETKYRWRERKRTCPNCNKETIIVGKEEYGGGFLCWKKKGGCGAKFPKDHPIIINQQTGRIENEDVCDQINTMDKMAQKRALMAAILVTAGVSEYFTQDLEEVVNEKTGEISKVPAPSPSEDKAPSVSLSYRPEWDERKEHLKSLLREMAAKNPMWNEEEYFKEVSGKDTAQLKHIDMAATEKQMERIEQAIENAEEWILSN